MATIQYTSKGTVVHGECSHSHTLASVLDIPLRDRNGDGDAVRCAYLVCPGCRSVVAKKDVSDFPTLAERGALQNGRMGRCRLALGAWHAAKERAEILI